MTAAPPAPPAPTVGEYLGAERRRRGITVAEVAGRTRVSERQIRALEAGLVDELPPHPYVRGFLEAYAGVLGIEGGVVLRMYEQGIVGEDAGGGDRRLFRYPDEDRFNWRDWTIPLLLVAGLGLFAAGRALLLPSADLAPAPSTAPVPAVHLAPAPLAAEGVTARAEAPSPPAGESPGVRVLLRSEGTTWVAAAVDGAEEKRYDLGPGQNLELAARERLGVTLGDAGLIRVSYNDRELGFVGMKGETKRGLLFPAQKAPPVSRQAENVRGPRREEAAPGD